MPVSAAPLPLFGRASELGRLESVLETAAAGRGAAGLIEGEAGIGKSRLLEEVLDRARSRDFRVLPGAGHELEREFPFAPLAQALAITRRSPDPARSHLAGLIWGSVDAGRATLAPSQEPELQFRVIEAIIELIEDLSGEAPVLLALDDFQWADPATLRVLGILVRRFEHWPVALLTALRPVPRPSDFDAFLGSLRERGAVEVVLGPLPSGSVRELVREVVAGQPEDALVEHLERAGGNPFFVSEMARALHREGAITVTEGRARLHRRVLPPSLRLTILRELSFLSNETLDVLRVAATLGSPFTIRDLALVLARRPIDVGRSLQQALDAGVVLESGEALSFRHDLVREAVYEDIPRPLRKAIHRDAGSSLAAAGAPAPQVAVHMSLGASPGDAEAVEWLHRAARDLLERAPGIAADLLRRAIDVAGENAGDRPALFTDLVVALMFAGRLDEAEGAAREALRLRLSPRDEFLTRSFLARVLTAAGRAPEAIEQLEAAQAFPDISESERTWLLMMRCVTGTQTGQVDTARTAANEAVEAAKRAGTDPAMSLALGASGMVALFEGYVHTGVADLSKAVDHARRDRTMEAHRHAPMGFFGTALIEADRLEEAEQVLQEGRRLSERLGSRYLLPGFYATLAAGRFYSGKWDDAVAEHEAGIAVADETGMWSTAAWSLGTRAIIAVHRGELDSARKALEEADGAFVRSPTPYRGIWVAWARALLAEAEGNEEEALAVLETTWTLLVSLGVRYEHRTMGPDLVRLYVKAGRSDAANTVADSVAEAATMAAARGLHAVALRCRGLAASDVHLLLQSVASQRRAPRPLELASACEDGAVALYASGRGEEASRLLVEALDLYDGLRASRDVARVEARMRDVGIRHRRRTTRSRATSGWESLTPTEREVVRLVGEGLRNRQIAERLFISPRTVESHLAHVFRKLDVSSRLQLVTAVAPKGK